MSRPNKELREEAAGLAAQLGRTLEVDLERLNQPALLALLEELHAAAKPPEPSGPERPVAAPGGAVRASAGPEAPAPGAAAPAPPLPPSDPPGREPTAFDVDPNAPVDGAGPASLGGPPPPRPRRPVAPRPRTLKFADTVAFVAKGKALTSRRGMLDEGAEVRRCDLPGGREQFDRLVRAGLIVPRG